MRINGNHIDRLIVNVLPWTVIIGTILYLIKRSESISKGFILTTIALWLMDTIVLRFKRPKTLVVKHGRLIAGGVEVKPDEIKAILPATDSWPKWSFDMVEFQLIDDRKFKVIDR